MPIGEASFGELTFNNLPLIEELFANRLKPAEEVDWFTDKLIQQRESLPDLQNYYHNELDSIHTALFPYLPKKRKQALINQLLYTFYLFYAQREFDKQENKRHNLKKHRDVLYRCADYIFQLELSTESEEYKQKLELYKQKLRQEEYEEEQQENYALYYAYERRLRALRLEFEVASFGDKPARYLWLWLAIWLTERMVEFSSGKRRFIITWIDWINGGRLYWVWAGGGLIGTLLELIPAYCNIDQAKDVLSFVSPITGYMSFGLYALRFILEWSFLDDYDMQSEQDPTYERFRILWKQRKFRLYNDSFWGWANLLCYFFLTGAGPAGTAGNIFTFLLLIMDVGMSIWEWWEEDSKHEAQLFVFDQDKILLHEKIEILNNEIEFCRLEIRKQSEQIAEREHISSQQRTRFLNSGTNRPNQLMIERLKRELHEKTSQKSVLEIEHLKIDSMIEQFTTDWGFKRKGLLNNIVYTSALLFVFGWICFAPLVFELATASIIITAGTILCFALNIWATWAATSIDCDQPGSEYQKIVTQRRDKFASLSELKNQSDHLKESLGEGFNERGMRQWRTLRRHLKLNYLELRQLDEDLKTCEQRKVYENMQQLRKMLIDILVPIMVLVPLVLFSLGLALSIIGACVTLVIFSNQWVEQYQPEKTIEIYYDKAEFIDYMDHLESHSEPEPRALDVQPIADVDGDLIQYRPLYGH